MNLGFKDPFVPYVYEGSKTHTIRPGERWRPGMRADLFARSRQPKKFAKFHDVREGHIVMPGEDVQVAGMKLLFRAQVAKVEPIHIVDSGCPGYTLYDRVDIYLDGRELDSDERDVFAWRDGFREENSKPIDISKPADCMKTVGAFERMAKWWQKEHDLRNKPFNGQVVHWMFDHRTDVATPESLRYIGFDVAAPPTPKPLSPAAWGEMFENMAVRA